MPITSTGTATANSTASGVSPLRPASIISAESFGTPHISMGYKGSGNIYIGSIGYNQPVVKLSFPLSFSWVVNAAVETSKSFSWGVGDLPYYWFRVVGTPQQIDSQNGSCRPGSPIGMPTPTGFNAQFLTMVMAQTPKQVCEQLSASNFVWQIAEMGRFSTPVNHQIAVQQNAAGIIDINCNQLIPVPFSQYASCAQYNLSGNAVVPIGADMLVMDTFLNFRGSGRISLSGSASTNNPNDHHLVGSGGIHIGGSANVTSSYFRYVGSGDIRISGSAGVISSQWNTHGRGGIHIGGHASITSTQFKIKGSGDIHIDGDSASKFKLKYDSNGMGSVGPTFAGIQISGNAGLKALYYFKAHGSGGVHIGGRAGTFSSNFRYTGDGNINIGGHALTISPSFHTSGNGGIHIGGNALSAFALNRHGSGGIHVVGSANPLIVLSTHGSGGIHISGSAVINHFRGSGGIHIGGSAHIDSTWKGIFVDHWGWNDVCQDLAPVFGQGTVVPYIPPSNVVTACGATNLPLALQISQNITTSSLFANFLKRNNFTFPTVMNLAYRRVTGTWRGNVHYTGNANDTSNETWDFVVEWGCVADAYGLSISPVWKLSINISRKNNFNAISFDTRVLIYLDTQPLANSFNTNGVDLNVSVNTSNGKVTILSNNATVQESTLFDGIGLFAGSNFPLKQFKFRIQPIGQYAVTPRYNIAPIFPQPGEYSVT